MNLLSCSDFKEEERRKNEHKKEHPIFNRAFNVAVRIQDRQELRTEKRLRDRGRIESFVSTATSPRLRIIAPIIGNLPFRIKPIALHRSFCGQKSAAKSRIAPIRFQCCFVLHAEWREKDSFA